MSTQEVQQFSDAWLVTCNQHRPHDALGGVPPLTDLTRVTARSESKLNHTGFFLEAPFLGSCRTAQSPDTGYQ